MQCPITIYAMGVKDTAHSLYPDYGDTHHMASCAGSTQVPDLVPIQSGMQATVGSRQTPHAAQVPDQLKQALDLAYRGGRGGNAL